MRVRRIIRTKLIEKLPPRYRFIIERLYLYYFARNHLRKELRIIQRLCNRCKASLDIGASDGTITLFLSKFSSHVYCFEPVPRLNGYLRQKFNDCNVTVESCALGNFNEDLCLNIPNIGSKKFETRSSLIKDFESEYILGEKVTDIERVKVKVRRLDDFNISNIGFIKVDVEGFEFEVLKGGENTIRKERPNMFIEIEQRHHKKDSFFDIFQYIMGLGFLGYFIDDRKLKRIEEFDVETMQKETNEKSDNYINNFIFLPDRGANLYLNFARGSLYEV